MIPLHHFIIFIVLVVATAAFLGYQVLMLEDKDKDKIPMRVDMKMTPSGFACSHEGLGLISVGKTEQATMDAFEDALNDFLFYEAEGLCADDYDIEYVRDWVA